MSRLTSLWGTDALFTPDTAGILTGMDIAKGACVKSRLRARHQIAGVTRAVSAPFGLGTGTSRPLADVPRTQRAISTIVDAVASRYGTPDERRVCRNERSHRGNGRGIIVVVSRTSVSRSVRLSGRLSMTVGKTPTLSWVRPGSGHGYVVISRPVPSHCLEGGHAQNEASGMGNAG